MWQGVTRCDQVSPGMTRYDQVWPAAENILPLASEKYCHKNWSHTFLKQGKQASLNRVCSCFVLFFFFLPFPGWNTDQRRLLCIFPAAAGGLCVRLKHQSRKCTRTTFCAAFCLLPSSFLLFKQNTVRKRAQPILLVCVLWWVVLVAPGQVLKIVKKKETLRAT